MYFYYNIFSSVWDSLSSIDQWYRNSSNTIWRDNTNNIIIQVIQQASTQLSIWFYTIFIAFIINSFAIVNILKNLYKLSGKTEFQDKNNNEGNKWINEKTWNIRV